MLSENIAARLKMADLLYFIGLEHIVEKPVLQNSIYHNDAILNCNLLDLINVSRELEVILDGSDENPIVANRDTPKINFNIHSTKDKPANND